jgi:hypothetical protein
MLQEDKIPAELHELTKGLLDFAARPSDKS